MDRRWTYDSYSELDTMRARARTRERLTSMAMLTIMAGTVAVTGVIVYASVWVVTTLAGMFGQQQRQEVRDVLPRRSAMPTGVVMLLPPELRR